MKPLYPALFVLAAVTALAAQKPFFKDNKGDISILANDWSGELVPPDFKSRRFTLVGNASVASRAQGLAATAARISGVLEPDPSRKGAQRLDDLKASGGVTLIRTRTETVAGKPVSGRTDAKGETATYQAGANGSGIATLNTNVVIIDELGARKVNLLGNSGTANFSTAQAGRSALKSATMNGNVRIKVTQVDSAGVAQVYNASGDRLDYTNAGDSGTLTLSGNVKLNSPGDDGGDLEGVQRAVLTLNAKGELTRVQFFNNDSGGRIKTVIRTKKSPAPKQGG